MTGDPADYDHDLEQLMVPVLIVSLQGDALVPRPSVDYLARKLTRAQVAQIELRAEDGKAYHHFRWVKKPAAILAQSINGSVPSSVSPSPAAIERRGGGIHPGARRQLQNLADFD